MNIEAKGSDRPKHSHLCVCEACAPKNRGLLERLIAEHDALIARLEGGSDD